MTIPAVPDSDRYVSYLLSVSTTSVLVPFPVYGDEADIKVLRNGAALTLGVDYSVTSVSGVAIASQTLPITDMKVTFTPALSSGKIEIIGDWRPRELVIPTAPGITRTEYETSVAKIVSSLRELRAALTRGVASFLRTVDGSPIAALPVNRANSLLGFDANGNPVVGQPATSLVSPAMQPVVAAGTVDAARSLIGVPTGLQTPLVRPPKYFARSWAEAVAMCDDQSEMRGWAKWGGTTGGAGKNTFKVWSPKDDGSEGTLRYAVAQAKAAGGGRVIFVPVGKFVVQLTKTLTIDFQNLTIDAPGRNVTLVALNDVKMISLEENNIIIRRLVLSRLPHYTHIDGDNIYEADGIAIDPMSAQRIWIDQCTFTEHSDGAIDCASSLLVPRVAKVRVTVSRCYFRRQDKCCLFASTATSLGTPAGAGAPAWAATAVDQEAVITATFDRNVFEGAGQRGPRVGALCSMHSVNNIHLQGAYSRDDGTASACYAILSTTGGQTLSEGDYVELMQPTAGAHGFYADTEAWATAMPYGPGALKINGSYTGAGLTSLENLTAKVPAPYSTITVEPVPTDAAARAAWVADKIADAGAEVSPLSEMNYVFMTTEAANLKGFTYADGYHVVAANGGFYVRTNDAIPALGAPEGGSYTPTVSNASNCTATVQSAFYTVVGNVVSVAGVVSITTTGGAVDSSFLLSLPIPSVIAANSGLAGIFAAWLSGASQYGAIEASSYKAMFRFTPTGNNTRSYPFTFTYTVQ